MAGSQEALVRRSWAAINAGSSADEIMVELGGLLHPEVEYVNPADALEQGTRRGVDGVRAALENYLGGVGPDAVFEIEQLLERDDRVYVRGHIHARGASSGVAVDGPGIGMVTSFRDGLICRMEWFWDKAEAFARFERGARG